MFGSVSIRLRDAIALQAGISFAQYFQVSYSYDFLVSKLKNYSSGSHEIMIATGSIIAIFISPIQCRSTGLSTHVVVAIATVMRAAETTTSTTLLT